MRYGSKWNCSFKELIEISAVESGSAYCGITTDNELDSLLRCKRGDLVEAIHSTYIDIIFLEVIKTTQTKRYIMNLALINRRTNNKVLKVTNKTILNPTKRLSMFKRSP
jgi:hypothetical protein